MQKTEEWLTAVTMQFKKYEAFIEQGPPICDAITSHRFALLFGDVKNHDGAMKAHFVKHGVPIKSLYSDIKNDKTFI